MMKMYVEFTRIGEDDEKIYLNLTLEFIQQCLKANHNQNDYLYGTPILSILVAIFENMQGRLCTTFPDVLSTLFDELSIQQSLSSETSPFQSMLLQGLSMAFAYNAPMVFDFLKSRALVLRAFQMWFSFMPNFTTHVELRRVLFGLCAILMCDADDLPEMILVQLPEIMNKASHFTIQLHKVKT